MDYFARNLPPLSRLKPFESAARHESFSLAADELAMTQAAVSKQIAFLESELGVALFERRNRAVFLTDAGRRLSRVVRTALMDISHEVAVICGDRRSNELILHCQLCEAFYWLMPRLSGFHQQHPDVELRVVSSLNPLTQSPERFDVAIQTSGRAFGSARLVFTAEDEIWPVCSPTLVSPDKTPLPPAGLLKHPLLLHHVVQQDWMDWESWFEAMGLHGYSSARIVPLDSYPLAIQSAVMGNGIALGWRRTTQGLIEEGKLIRPCAESIVRPTELSVFSSGERNRHPDAHRLLDWLSEELLSKKP